MQLPRSPALAACSRPRAAPPPASRHAGTCSVRPTLRHAGTFSARAAAGYVYPVSTATRAPRGVFAAPGAVPPSPSHSRPASRAGRTAARYCGVQRDPSGCKSTRLGPELGVATPAPAVAAFTVGTSISPTPLRFVGNFHPMRSAGHAKQCLRFWVDALSRRVQRHRIPRSLGSTCLLVFAPVHQQEFVVVRLHLSFC